MTILLPLCSKMIFPEQSRSRKPAHSITSTFRIHKDAYNQRPLTKIRLDVQPGGSQGWDGISIVSEQGTEAGRTQLLLLLWFFLRPVFIGVGELDDIGIEREVLLFKKLPENRILVIERTADRTKRNTPTLVGDGFFRRMGFREW
ncbi:hypothetical protein CRG98_001533, partial [Punica granatum]